VTVYGLQKVCFDPYKSEKHFCLNAIDFSVPKISVFVLLVCSKLDWHKTLSLDILVFIVTRYSHCWGVLDNLATLRTVYVQVVRMWRHISKETTYSWCICEEASPDYDQSALEQFIIDFVIIPSGYDVQQSVHFCCLGTMLLDWCGVDITWDSEDMIGPISCSQMNPVST